MTVAEAQAAKARAREQARCPKHCFCVRGAKHPGHCKIVWPKCESAPMPPPSPTAGAGTGKQPVVLPAADTDPVAAAEQLPTVSAAPMAAAGTCSVAAGISHTGAAAVEKPDPGPRSLVCVKCGKVCNSTGALGRHMGSKACKALASGIDLSDVKVRRQFYDELRASSVGARRKQQPPPLQRPEELPVVSVSSSESQ